MGYRETKVFNARQLGGIYFIEPDDEEFKLTMNAARRKLEVSMPAAMLFKIPMKSSGETHRNIEKHKTNCACVVDAEDSTRLGLEGAVHEHHIDYITERGMNSVNHYSLVHKFIPMPQTMKIPDAKTAVVKMRETQRKFRHGS